MFTPKKEIYDFYKPILIKYKSLFVLLMISWLITWLSSVVMPVLLKMETDQLVSKSSDFFWITNLWAFEIFIIILSVILIVNILEMILSSVTEIFSKAKNDLLRNDIQLNMFKRMENMEIGRSMNSRYKHITSIVENEFEKLTDQIVKSPKAIIEFFIKIFWISIIYAYFDIKLLFIVILFSISRYFISEAVRKIIKKYEIDWTFSLWKQARKYSSLFMFKLPELAISGWIKSTLKNYQTLLDKEVENWLKKDFSQLKYNITYLINSNFLDICLKLIVWYWVFYWTSSVGMVVLVVSSMKTVESIVSDILWFKQKYSDYIFRQESILIILKLCENIWYIEFNEKIEKIEFKNIKFAYPNLAKYEKDYLDIVQNHIIWRDLWNSWLDKRIKSMISSIEEDIWKENQNILNNLSFCFEKWKVYWVVWKNWAWKTSMMYLLAGFFRNYSWSILLNWTESKDFKTTSFLDKVSFLSQIPFNMWWNSTIRENLTLGTIENISDEKIYNYLEKFWLSKKIHKSKKWLDSMMWDDIEFSGWEIQIIAFIRILLQNRDIIILDEWTNQLDAENEILVMNELLKFKSEKIIIFITHRMSTISKADIIFCLEDWYFKNFWTHKELLEQKDNIYNIFYRNQVLHES